jgi:ATP-dependent 26S proteasome regulatory subunit
MEIFRDSTQHLLAELERIDVLIRAQVERARQVYPPAKDEFQGLYISEQEIDLLLDKPVGLPLWAQGAAPWDSAAVQSATNRMAAQLETRAARSLEQGVPLRLAHLARLFQLTRFDLDTLLITLAPSLDTAYERLYAYLQDDVTKKRPSVDLVLNLLRATVEEKFQARLYFQPDHPLFRYRLLERFDDPLHHQPSLLNQYLKISERVVAYLLGSDGVEETLQPAVHVLQPALQPEQSLPQDMLRLARLARPGAIFHFYGPYGAGKQTVAEALCEELGLRLLVVEGDMLLGQTQPLQDTLRLLQREATLQNAAVYWKGFDMLREQPSALSALLAVVSERPDFMILSGQTAWYPADMPESLQVTAVPFTYPSYQQRLRLWQTIAPEVENEPELPLLADKFRFTAGQIKDTAAAARGLALWRQPDAALRVEDLYAASREQSRIHLETLASKITPHYRWPDIILPPDRLEQLRDVCNAIKYRAQVYETWGFDRKLSAGKGVNVLFAGPSGTGKTMAADIIAGELGLDLYRIDLAMVVSKYIGETEKNLARIFNEAEMSSAILFFDEADALFGKRSEVRDSHDRYANIEISYLLQRMEGYEGMVILATNFRKNMDEAFVRRLHFTVDFPFPGEADRYRIWQAVWPPELPRDPDLDLALLARRLEISGGNIRNIALAAAFRAADEGLPVNMQHVFQAARREYQKMGKVAAESFL